MGSGEPLRMLAFSLARNGLENILLDTERAGRTRQ